MRNRYGTRPLKGRCSSPNSFVSYVNQKGYRPSHSIRRKLYTNIQRQALGPPPRIANVPRVRKRLPVHSRRNPVGLARARRTTQRIAAGRSILTGRFRALSSSLLHRRIRCNCCAKSSNSQSSRRPRGNIQGAARPIARRAWQTCARLSPARRHLGRGGDAAHIRHTSHAFCDACNTTIYGVAAGWRP
jgi:hypothetical protein